MTSPIIAWYRDRGILVSVDAMRSAQQIGREILAALEAMRPFLDQAPGQARHSVDLTGLGDAFGARPRRRHIRLSPPAGHQGWPRPGMAAAGYQPRQDLLGAAGKPLEDTPRGLTAGSTSTWTTRPGLARTARQTRDRLPPPDPAEPGEWNRRSVRRLRRRGRLRPERLAGDLAHRQSRRRRLAANHVPLRDPVSHAHSPAQWAAWRSAASGCRLEPMDCHVTTVGS